MVRTQVYLTERQRAELAAIAETSGKKQSELIREAIDQLIERSSKIQRQVVLRKTFGLWRDRDDLPDFEALRTEWNRTK